MIPGGGSGIRAVVHRDIDDEDIERALELIEGVMRAPSRPASRVPQNSVR